MASGRKVVIKPFRAHCQMDKEQAQQMWRVLASAVAEIYNKNASVLSFEELYRNAYNLVLHKHGDLLYTGIQETVRTRLRSVMEDVIRSPDDQLLSQVCVQWKEHQVTMVMVRDILMYMDRTYVPQSKKMTVYDLGLWAFRETIVRHELVRERLRKLLLANIRSERLGQLIDHNSMRCALNMLTELGGDGSSIYEEDFELFFLEDTCRFYRCESRLFLSEHSCPDYLRKIESRITEEMKRVPNYLHASTRPKLKHIVEHELISAHASTLIGSKKIGFSTLLKESEYKMDDLRRMYALFLQAPATLDMLRTALYEHARTAGRLLIIDQIKEPIGFVRSLLALRTKYEKVVYIAFQRETLAQKKLKEAFDSFLNADIRCASSLVAYIDELMRTGFKGSTESEVEHELDKVIVIFRYLQDKDIFEVFYKQYLAKRLLNRRSTSSEAERQMLAKLKSECGYQYTTKLEGMLTDIRFSRNTMEKYAAHQDRLPPTSEVRSNASGSESDTKESCDMEVTVLTSGYWPPQSIVSCAIPSHAAAAAGDFQSFYLEQHSGRKLTWLTGSGTAELKASFSATAKHELNVSTYQMCILSQFNKLNCRAELSLQEIIDVTKIPHIELKRHLVSLCTPKHRILQKKSKGKGLSNDDSFQVNELFLSKLKRIRVPLVAMREITPHPHQTDHIPAAVQEDRRHLCEATVVRIMKARKQAKHNDLIAEVTRQLNQRFYPQPQSIKKCIESLLEREYLERSSQDPRMYIYLA